MLMLAWEGVWRTAPLAAVRQGTGTTLTTGGISGTRLFSVLQIGSLGARDNQYFLRTTD